ncbi:hypothetical protein ACFRKD_32175 [Streptomyces niveus]|uniref:hypothetical protein n=1 Tax=Streptomyces niveus TaxID=193462 RepID=UPI0036B592C5
MRTVAIPVVFAFTTLMVLAGHAQAADIDPTGIGDLMPSPDSKVPAGQGTLYETYSNTRYWRLDSDFGKWDILDPMAEFVADFCMAMIAVLGTACIVIVMWIFQLTSIPGLEEPISASIGGAAKGLTATLLPTSLAVGSFVAFTQHKKGGGGGGMSQIAWVLISGVFSVSLLTSPQVWVGGVDSARQIGAGITMNATSAGLGDGSGDFPFKLDHEPKFTGNGRDDMLRKSSDAVWRSYVATPWCVAEFGSFEVCEKYGRQLLDQGTDADKRKKWLQQEVDKEAVGSDSVTWRQGHDPVGRIMVTVPALISIILFAALVLMLAFTSLASLLGALMLLLTGVIFACLWVIPGRPRQWGLAWFDQLLARTLESLIATMTLGAVLSLQAATVQMFEEYGWLPTSGLSIAAAVVAMRFRNVLATIFGIQGTSSSGMVAGLLAARMLNRTGRSGRRRTGGGHHNEPVTTLPPPGTPPGAGGGPPALPPGPSGTPAPVLRPPVPPPLPLPPFLLPASPGGAPGGAPGGGGGPTLPPANAAVTAPPSPPRVSPLAPPLPTGGSPAPGPPQPAVAPPSPTLRPGSSGAPSYVFRQAPPAAPPSPQPRVIQGTVIRRTSTPQPRRVPPRPTPRPPRPDSTGE